MYVGSLSKASGRARSSLIEHHPDSVSFPPSAIVYYSQYKTFFLRISTKSALNFFPIFASIQPVKLDVSPAMRAWSSNITILWIANYLRAKVLSFRIIWNIHLYFKGIEIRILFTLIFLSKAQCWIKILIILINIRQIVE